MPEWVGAFSKRIPIARLQELGSGLVAGKITRDKDQIYLEDASGKLILNPSFSRSLKSMQGWAAIYQASDGGQELRFFQPIAAPQNHQAADHHRWRTRWQIHQAIRQWFLGAGFTEVDTPIRVRCPGMEPYLDSFAAGNRYLRTSPELHMKQLLALGIEPIFQMAPSFRAGDHGSQHREEFIMLEWYRLFADLGSLSQDLSQLLYCLAPFAQDEDYFRKPLLEISCYELFDTYLGLQLKDHHNREPLIEACQREAIHYQDSDDWDTLFFRLFLAKIEPHLGQDAPTLVTQYPASMSALAKQALMDEGKLPTCLRFELYLKGVEIANAFYELTDPKEQRRRFEADRRERAQLDKPVYEIDEDFMAALESGMPPAAGIALGVDRLVMALLGIDNFSDLLPFS